MGHLLMGQYYCLCLNACFSLSTASHPPPPTTRPQPICDIIALKKLRTSKPRACEELGYVGTYVCGISYVHS